LGLLSRGGGAARPTRNVIGMPSNRSIAGAAEAVAKKAQKEADGLAAQVAAVAEAARIRKMFAEDRRKLDTRYGAVRSLENDT
jgi:hypothetical protein